MKILQINIHDKTNYVELDLSSLIIGATLVFNVYIKQADNYVIIIEAGTMLSQTLYEKLQRQEKIYISKKNEDRQILSCATLNNYVIYNINNLETALSFLYTINNKIFDEYYKSQNDFIDMACLEEIVNIIIVLVKKHPKFLKEIIPHFSTKYEIAYHSLHVTIYAITLAHFLNFTNEQLFQIGKAAMMHDLGIKKINEKIKQKDSSLTLEEGEIMHKHSEFSLDIAKKNFVSNQYILDAIVHHHENHDGTGYPHHLKSQNIRSFASILSISDVFDALTSERPYREKYSTFDALKIMMKDETTANKFNQQYFKVFLKMLLNKA